MIGGFFGWTLMENILHSYLFHSEHYWLGKLPASPALFATHSVMHGLHHAFPTDPYRMVEAPFITYIIGHFIIKPLF